MSTGFTSTGGSDPHQRNSLAGSVEDLPKDYVPEGANKMNQLFD
jgi:hypothetical protein